MAKSGAPSNVMVRGGARSAETRRLLIEAAVDVLSRTATQGPALASLLSVRDPIRA